jgi:hypothetical protein
MSVAEMAAIDGVRRDPDSEYPPFLINATARLLVFFIAIASRRVLIHWLRSIGPTEVERR